MAMKPKTDDPKLSPESTTSPPKKVIIKSADMKEEQQKEAVNIAISAFEKNNVEKDVAERIKKEFDKTHGPTWHCIIGRNFVRAVFVVCDCISVEGVSYQCEYVR
ncbi:hypothetical protein Goshw_005840 [Gossypium schwendimanii]|uniref:Dynein light chain n=2 Tax=Gossypium TaxID=3633 RepID=A0A7J9LE91_GOSSC|nr:hypothetical protein [Gossypium schwendimanii]